VEFRRQQRWNLQEVSGAPGIFNILVSKGTDTGKKYLSCTSNGQTVDLFDKDDGSGRQRWQLIDFQIKVAGGTNNRQFLSCTPNGLTVDLWDNDDGSGRQRWQLQLI
jgi:hypothetical protein